MNTYVIHKQVEQNWDLWSKIHRNRQVLGQLIRAGRWEDLQVFWAWVARPAMDKLYE